MNERYFPQGIATDYTFCNRESERNALRESIEAHQHIVLAGPRRYGKTSLITQVLIENNFPGVSIDFFFALNQTEVQKSINEGVSEIISQLLPKTQSACNKIVKHVKAVNPKLTFNLFGQKLEISTKQTSEKSISEVLLALDFIAKETKKSCVLILDEFQQIGELKENHAIEAAIRHAVERSRNVSYVFCGSKRHLLHEMFSNKSRPLYHLCDLMTIGRISSESHHHFLNKTAQKRWKKILKEDAVEEILHLTENHPYYVNALCRRLWRNDTPPDLSLVRKTWAEYVGQQAPWITTDLAKLTLNRRKVLVALAHAPTNEPQGQIFSEKSGLNPSGIKKCLDDLEKMDFVYKDAKGFYQVLDPAIAYFIREHSS